MRPTAMRVAIGAAVSWVMAAHVAAAEKSRYWLLDPMPDHLLRDMSTDRPDTTESPFTVDAGRFQIETSLFAYSRSRADEEGAVTERFEFAATNLRVGLTHAIEIGFVWRPYGIVRTRGDAAAGVRESGVGGLDIRAKFGLWGNDTFEQAGATALALLPFVSLPTDRDNGIGPEAAEGGLIVPFAIRLSEAFSLGLNGGAVFREERDSSDYRAEYLVSASLAHEWSERLGTYYEVAARLHTGDPRGDSVVLGTGVTYGLSDNVQLDAGATVGVTSAADRIAPFVGLSMRF